MSTVMKAVLFVYAAMVMLVLGVALSPAKAQIYVTPPHMEFGYRHAPHGDNPYRYEDYDHDRYWRHHYWRHRHHHDDDDD